MIVVWRVTEHCNLSCKFCGYDRELSRPRRTADPGSIHTFGAVLAAYQQSAGDPVLVSWLGGEPLRWLPLTQLTRAFRQEYGLRLSTTTNGTSLGSPQVRGHLLENYAELTVSVDGLGQLHDQLRGWAGGFAFLERHITALAEEKRLANRGPLLRANVLLMRETLPGFEQLCLRLARWGIEELTFNQLGGNDRPEFFPDHRLLPDQADSLAAELPQLRDRLSALGVRLRGSDAYARRIQASSRGEKLPVNDCHPGTSFCFIDESGRAAPCSFTTSGYGVPIQQITSVAALRQLPLLFAERRRQNPLPTCRDCHSTHVFEKFTA